MFNKSLAAAGLIVGLCAPMLAQAGSLSSYDADGDSTISRTEFFELQKDQFATMDTNSDGVLAISEVEAATSGAGKALVVKSVMSRDGNGDGVIDVTEFGTKQPAFDRADRNRDGVLTSNEIAKAEAFMNKPG